MAAIATAFAWPVVVRHLVVSRLEGLTHRTVRIDAVTVNPFTGRVAVTGLQLFEGDDEALFAAVERFDARVRPLALLRGHLSIADAVLEGPTVRIVRRADDFNVSDLFDRSGPGGVALDVTVDRFVVTRGTVTLEDRALREPRTWRSESIEIEARNLSTLRDDGRAVARSVTAGAPASLELTKVRLRPIHLEAVVKTTGLDLGLARLYFPPDAAVVLERGRASSTLEVVLDAREGVRATATGELADVVLVRPGEREPAAVLPKTALRLSELVYREDALSIGRLELTGSASVRDPVGGARCALSGVDAPGEHRRRHLAGHHAGPPRRREQCARRRDGAGHGRASAAARIEPVEAPGQERGPRPVGESRAGQGADHGHRQCGSARR